MEKVFKAAFALFVGALIGAVGFSVLVYLLFWMLNTQQTRNDGLGYSIFMFFFTVPFGGFIGGIIGLVWFLGEGS